MAKLWHLSTKRGCLTCQADEDEAGTDSDEAGPSLEVGFDDAKTASNWLVAGSNYLTKAVFVKNHAELKEGMNAGAPNEYEAGYG